ncbi:MAG TPA: low affinity iron permease family protein [Devosia sp.]|nr:low affinity iron permease family protein [Devosia sp.]
MPTPERMDSGPAGPHPDFFTRFSHRVSHAAGKPVTFALACTGILIWALSGPLFGFSETWQLVINTGTTIITFLMVFVLQNSQNRDGEALQAKLDELLLVVRDADNRFIGAEQLGDKELKKLHQLLLTQAREASEELEKIEEREEQREEEREGSAA